MRPSPLVIKQGALIGPVKRNRMIKFILKLLGQSPTRKQQPVRKKYKRKVTHPRIEDPANTIWKLRLKLNLSQRDLAAMLNVSQGAVAHWELGMYQPGRKNSFKIQEIIKNLDKG